MLTSRPSFVFVKVLLLYSYHTLAQTSTATWQFPLEDGLTINFIDTVVLEWTSNYNTAWMNMWCQDGLNGSVIGNDVVLGSQFQVQPSGSFPYIMFTEDPTEATFPVACHAQLVADEPNGNTAVDDPVGITFTSNTKIAAKTFSSSTSASSTSTTSSSSSSISSSGSNSRSSSSILSAPLSTTNFSSDTPTSPTTSAPLPTHSSDASLGGGAKAGIGISATIGGIAVLCIIAFIFRRRKRTAENNYVADSDNKEAPVAGRFGRYELEDEGRRRHELPAKIAAHELEEEQTPRPRYELAG